MMQKLDHHWQKEGDAWSRLWHVVQMASYLPILGVVFMAMEMALESNGGRFIDATSQVQNQGSNITTHADKWPGNPKPIIA